MGILGVQSVVTETALSGVSQRVFYSPWDYNSGAQVLFLREKKESGDTSRCIEQIISGPFSF